MNNKQPLFNIFSTLLPALLLSYTNTTLANETIKIDANTGHRAEQEVQTNIKYLLGHVLNKSQALQEAYGDFSPYGAALFKSGTVKYVWHAKPGQLASDQNTSFPLIWKALKTQVESGQIAASAVIYKFKKEEGNQPFLGVALEYQTGVAFSFASEMIINKNNKVTWGRGKQVPSKPKLFILEDQTIQD